ncbi:TRAP transporter substrate-binding protein [Salipaludibacillus aurantiacus]|uniref:Tripartite ATP-independent transporter solute receptor, DctP family n=1 Tax=Salipaludibacillus aurantiacus TaxID=1601833 RepID=A0A1H9UB16_9BACI|nr:TRAP transporter substrate-binding protein [Salipaludibacillus aurantiacus]SES06532.1 tripartite ATP-independent transporter solute receptor, DctP family [Salipaludibacillus aurantiacus]
MKKSSLVTGALSLSLVFTLAACGDNGVNGDADQTDNENENASNNGNGEEAASEYNSSEATHVIEAGIGLNNQHPQYHGLLRFKEIVESETDGDVYVETYHSSQLGDDRQMMEALQLGSQEVTIPSTAPIANFVEQYAILDFPFLFPDEEIAMDVLNGDIGDQLLDALEDQEMVGLAWWENGYRDLTNSVQAVATAEDFQGLTIRTMENEVHLAAFQELGANPTPMAFGELFTAMQQGTVDGQENPLATIYLEGFYEVQDHYSDTNHVYSPFVFLMSKQFYDQLPDDYQEIVRNAAQEAGEYQIEENRKQNNELLDALVDEGVEYTEVTPEAREEMAEIVQPVNERFAEQIDPDFAEEVYSAIEEAQQNAE